MIRLIILLIGSILLYGRFDIWSQIITDFDQIDLISSHTIRIVFMNFLISIPKFLIGLSDIQSFNIICILCILINIKLLRDVVLKFNLTGLKQYLIIYLPLILGFFQNGRGVFLSLSISLLLYVTFIENNRLRELTFFFISFLFANFSSGVYFGFILSYTLLFFTQKNRFIFKKIVGLVILILNIPLMIIYFNKNLTFYDGELIRLLEHGVLIFLPSSISILVPTLIIIIAISITLFINLLIHHKKLNNPLTLFNTSALVMLFFGISAFVAFLQVIFLQALSITSKK